MDIELFESQDVQMQQVPGSLEATLACTRIL
jgi:hypothetical protein